MEHGKRAESLIPDGLEHMLNEVTLARQQHHNNNTSNVEQQQLDKLRLERQELQQKVAEATLWRPR